MKKRTIIALIVAAVLTVSGLCLAAVAIVSAVPNFALLGSEQCVRSEHAINEEISSIAIRVDEANVKLLPVAQGESVRVVCEEYESETHLVSVKNGKLEIYRSRRNGFRLFSFDTVTITVYLPASAYASLSVESDTGDVAVPADFSFEELHIETDTGDVSLLANVTGNLSVETNTGDVKSKGQKPQSAHFETDTGDIEISSLEVAQNLKIKIDTDGVLLENTTVIGLIEIEADTGDVTLREVVSGALSIETDTGDVELIRCDAHERIKIETDTGDVEALLLSEKRFQVRSRTGRERVPASFGDVECIVLSSTGDIEIEVIS